MTIVKAVAIAKQVSERAFVGQTFLSVGEGGFRAALWWFARRERGWKAPFSGRLEAVESLPYGEASCV
jgi:hypothetical protein